MSIEDKEKDYAEYPINLEYQYTAGSATTRFLHQVKEGRLVGQACPKCGAVYVPPRGSCPRDGVATDIEVPLTDKGCIESFTIVHIPIPGNPIVPPYVCAMIRLDGANISFLHLIQYDDLDTIRIGMRIQAVWKPQDEWTHSLENIKWFAPIDEPDIDVTTLRFEAS